MSSSAITTQVAQLKISSIQNQADSSGVYSAGVWSFKNSTAVASVTISDAGSVGIGTASPGGALGIARAAASSAFIEIAGNGNTPGVSSLFLGQDGASTGYVWNRANTALTFGTNAAERGRIAANGVWTLGTASTINVDDGVHNIYGGFNNTRSVGYNANPDVTLCTGGADNDTAVNNGTIYRWGFRVTGTAGGYLLRTTYVTRGGVWATGPYVTATTWTNLSDAKFKENVEDIHYGLNAVLTLQPRKFTWKNLQKEDIGFIAQEVKGIVPEVVDEQPEGMGVAYTQLIPVLVKAIQEQQTQIESLKAEVAALKAP